MPIRIVYESGGLRQVPAECLRLGSRGVVVHGKALAARFDIWNSAVTNSSAQDKITLYPYAGNEPSLTAVTELIRFAQEKRAAFICGIGGGSIIDLAKAAAGLFHAENGPEYYQAGGTLEKQGLPFIAVPTTAGAGAEATPNAVITSPDKKTKLSIRDKSFLARTVILDGDLLEGTPDNVLAHSGMDAFVQAYESFISKNATWMTDTLALKALSLVHDNLLPVIRDKDKKAMSRLLLGSFMAGNALAHARLGVIHGLAHPLGALYDAPHGLVCAVCLLPSVRLNREFMGPKYAQMSRVLNGDFSEKSVALIEALGIGSPFKGREVLERERIISETLKSGSTAANPKPIMRTDVEFLLRELF